MLTYAARSVDAEACWIKEIAFVREKTYIRTMCKVYLPFSAGDDKIMPEEGLRLYFMRHTGGNYAAKDHSPDLQGD